MSATSRTTFGVVVAAIALVLSAGAGATASLLITGKQIKNNSVTTADVKNRTLKAKDFSRSAKTKLRGPAGAAGPQGATGPAGPAGALGLPGLSGFEVVTKTLALNVLPLGAPASGSIQGACPAGKKAISATAGFAAPLAGLLSQVTRVSDTAFKASGVNTVVGDQTLTLDVVCAVVAS